MSEDWGAADVPPRPPRKKPTPSVSPLSDIGESSTIQQELVPSGLLSPRGSEKGDCINAPDGCRVSMIQVPIKGPKTKRDYIVEEIVTTEKAYVQSLRTLIGLWLLPLQNLADEDDQILSREDIKDIFSNIQLLLGVNEQLLDEMVKRIDSWKHSDATAHRHFADILDRYAPMFKLYTEYCSNYTLAQETFFREMNGNERFQDFLRSTWDMMDNKMEFPAFMIMPIQRVPRYILLMRDLLEKTSFDHPDYPLIQRAIRKLEEVASHANAAIKQGENVEKILKIQSQIIGANDLLQPARVFVMEGELMKIMSTGVRPCWYILFNDIMIYGYKRIADKIQKKGEFFLGTTWIRDLFDTDQLSNLFQIVAEKKTYTVYAKTPEEKEKWISTLGKVIDDLIESRPDGQELIKRRAKVKIKKVHAIFKPVTISPEQYVPELLSSDSTQPDTNHEGDGSLSEPTPLTPKASERTPMIPKDGKEEKGCCDDCTIL
mmetsp:Transcript_19181/g.53846  ORF Transcript_19181/g.53846 Transcript_19181/m.53846 type:complete len:488 (+) Transcript_19181:60-1523(+)|eukprot:CAMPEP_0119144558 /NCGR_PEP_ID=MMETSP1310-20130426/36049_1 /TAXON_ID=464262 /ORGANISM="Genus nov. species nov., Strain RCC2339" /LENGTH=487 /DNA_ID=CAMNT_0007136311 /DNA_START=57 /DNA_END=1520 /DNA_ORIENTATION=+